MVLVGGDALVAGGAVDPDPPPQAASVAATAEAAAREPTFDGGTEVSESADVTRSFGTVVSLKTNACHYTLSPMHLIFKRSAAMRPKSVAPAHGAEAKLLRQMAILAPSTTYQCRLFGFRS